jgi:hypothetical protein
MISTCLADKTLVETLVVIGVEFLEIEVLEIEGI